MHYGNMCYYLRKHRNVDRYELVVYSPAFHFGGCRIDEPTATKEDIAEVVGDEHSELFDSSQYSRRDFTYFSCLRAKKIVRDMIYNNEWQYFFTQTFSSKYDRYSIDDTVKRFLYFLSRFNDTNKRRKGIEPVKYLFIPERHHDGAWHLHGLVSHFPDLIPYTRKDFKRLPLYILKSIHAGKQIYYNKSFTNRFGWCTFSPVKDLSRIGTYICKYIMKQVGNGQNLDIGSHRYYASRGLQEPLKIELEHSRNMFRNQFLMSEILSLSLDKKYRNGCHKNDFYYKMILPSSDMKEFLEKVRGLKNVVDW